MQTKKNILMISIGDGILTNPVANAIERHENYAKSLNANIDMIVFSLKSKNLEPKFFKDFSIYPSKSLNQFTFIYDVFKIAKELMKNKKYHLITTQDPFGTALAGVILKKLYSIPLHIQNHSSFLNNQIWIEEKPFLFTIFNKIAQFTLKSADRLRVVNSHEKEKYVKFLNIHRDIIDVAPIPVDVDFWSSDVSENEKNEFLEKYKIDKSKPTFLWAGRLVKVKNLPFLFEALSHLDFEYNILIATDTKKSFWDLKELELKYKINPIYLGFLSLSELKIAYKISDIFLHTSLYEGFGLVVSDAIASGLPVVATKSDGVSDIITNNSDGFLVEFDTFEFAKKCEYLIKNDKIDEFKQNAKTNSTKKFDKAIMTENIINSWKKCL